MIPTPEHSTASRAYAAGLIEVATIFEGPSAASADDGSQGGLDV
jgi:hypothetical protein